MDDGATLLFLLQFRWFQVEVLQAMEKNVKLDKEYIDVSSPGEETPPDTQFILIYDQLTVQYTDVHSPDVHTAAGFWFSPSALTS